MDSRDARQHTNFAGDELEELSFAPSQFEAFCAELAQPAASLREQEPLSDQQKLDAFTSACIFDDDPLADAFYKGIEFAEKHHGIDAQRLGREKGN
jgi:hypothetical protein